MPPNVRRLKTLVRMHRLAVVGVCEPKLSRHDADSIRLLLNFDSIICNSTGELLVFFNSSFVGQVVGDSDQHLSICWGHPQFPVPILVSFVHAKCQLVERQQLWEGLLQDKFRQGPWYVMGDFNLVVSSGEKKEGRQF